MRRPSAMSVGRAKGCSEAHSDRLEGPARHRVTAYDVPPDHGKQQPHPRFGIPQPCRVEKPEACADVDKSENEHGADRHLQTQPLRPRAEDPTIPLGNRQWLQQVRSTPPRGVDVGATGIGIRCVNREPTLPAQPGQCLLGVVLRPPTSRKPAASSDTSAMLLTPRAPARARERDAAMPFRGLCNRANGPPPSRTLRLRSAMSEQPISEGSKAVLAA